MTAPRSMRSRVRQGGFTIIEMMVAMTIGLIVVMGFTASFVSMKSSFNSQGQLSQLQDNERLALSMLTTAANEAGYFPTPWSHTRADIIASNDTAGGGSMAQGWFIYGTAVSGTTPQTMSTAYADAASGGLLNCQGGTSATGGAVRNVFYVDAATKTLGCRVLVNNVVTSAYAPLITNVQSMDVLYGVNSSGTGNIDKYLAPADVTSSNNWLNVKSVRITLLFVNPNDSTKTIEWVQTANLMNNR